jgi:carbonic anhydrase/acetyltransferase-like protein (isoleucine patch superfamily)
MCCSLHILQCHKCPSLHHRCQADVCAAGDVNAIKVGENSTILDGVVVHVAKHNPQGLEAPTMIGNNVTIGKIGCNVVRMMGWN